MTLVSIVAALPLAMWVATSSSSVSGLQQRCVARDHHDRRLLVVVVAVEGGHPDRGGVAGAVLLDLLDERDVRPRRCALLHLLGDLFGAVADDHGGAIGLQLLEGSG